MSFEYTGSDPNLRYYFKGQPLQFNWRGWRASSYDLERDGWTFYAHEERDLSRDLFKVYIAATDPEKNIVIAGHWSTALHSLEYYPMQFLEEFYRRPFYMDSFMTNRASIKIADASEVLSWKAMNRVDLHSETRVQTLRSRDFKMFKEYEENIQEIYIPPDSVDECLDRILQLQYHEQKGLLIPEAKPIIKARILSL